MSQTVTWMPKNPKPVKIEYGSETVKTCDAYPGIERVVEVVQTKGFQNRIQRRVYFRPVIDRGFRLQTAQEAVEALQRIEAKKGAA